MPELRRGSVAAARARRGAAGAIPGVDRSAGPGGRLRELTRHGGRLIAARLAWPDAPEPWIDLSTGINPHPYPVGGIPQSAWTRLPQPEEEAALLDAAAAAFGVPPDCVALAPGSSALIALLPRLAPGPAAILGPTYGEYRAAWPDAADVATVDGLRGAQVRIVCQPNNPDGRVLSDEVLQSLVKEGLLVVDRAFAAPPCRALPGAVSLYSFGKLFGLAGMRLGFACAPAPLAAAIRHALGPWPVSGPALAIGLRALRDDAWIAATCARLAEDAARLDGLLAGAGVTVVGGTRLFRLAECDAAGWHEHLGRQGILTRRFADRPRWLRFGAPAEWGRLEEALRQRRRV